jgi:hypothetical protein
VARVPGGDLQDHVDTLLRLRQWRRINGRLVWTPAVNDVNVEDGEIILFLCHGHFQNPERNDAAKGITFLPPDGAVAQAIAPLMPLAAIVMRQYSDLPLLSAVILRARRPANVGNAARRDAGVAKGRICSMNIA